MQAPGAAPNFIERLKQALVQLGLEPRDVFIDTDNIVPGYYFLFVIHQAIWKCDLFIPVIGTQWTTLLDQKLQKEEDDVVVRELAAALKLERNIVPLLIDHDKMPVKLPEEIQELTEIDGESLTSDASVEALAAALAKPVAEITQEHRLGRVWNVGYALFSIALWALCGILPNAIGVSEFGFDTWIGMATGWAGMFIWPTFFMPFIMLALHSPCKTLVEAALNAGNPHDALRYAAPIFLGFLFAIGITISEISLPQVPWTVHPKLLAQCHGPDNPAANERNPAIAQYNRDLAILASYPESGAIPKDYRDTFWAKDACWPNVFFYLAIPLRESPTNGEYAAQRSDIQKAFLRVLGKDAKGFKGTEAPYSTLFPFYALAFFLMAWPLSSSIIMAIIYATISVRARGGRVLRIPSEDAILCLTYGFVTLLVWMPFRMTTNSIKNSYYCLSPADGCHPIWEIFSKDLYLGLALFTGYAALTVGLLWNHRRLLLGFLGSCAVLLIVTITLLVYKYYQTISGLTDYWQFWLANSLLLILVLIWLWYQYAPFFVRLKDFLDDKKQRDNGTTRRRDISRSTSESFAVTTITKAHQAITIREMRIRDAISIRRCISDPRFTMPYLTGTPDPSAKPVRPWLRSISYVLKAVGSRRFGRVAFGARRHWIMAIVDGVSGSFLGVALLDAVVRVPRGTQYGLMTRIFIEPHKLRADEEVGDAEWGFFVHPDFWGRGVAIQAIYALTAALADRPSWCAPGQNIVNRIYAETGATNRQAIALLQKAGLVRVDGKAIPATASPRFEPDGQPIELVHFEQPAEHRQLNPEAPVKALLKDMADRGVVSPGWQSHRTPPA